MTNEGINDQATEVMFRTFYVHLSETSVADCCDNMLWFIKRQGKDNGLMIWDVWIGGVELGHNIVFSSDGDKV